MQNTKSSQVHQSVEIDSDYKDLVIKFHQNSELKNILPSNFDHWQYDLKGFEHLLKLLFENSLWVVSFSSQFLKQINLARITTCRLISDGYFGRSTKLISSLANFCSYYLTDSNILFRVQVEKVPQLERNTVAGFAYKHKLIFLDKDTQKLPHFEENRAKNPYTSDYCMNYSLEGTIFLQKKYSNQQNLMLYKIYDDVNSGTWGHLEFKSSDNICWHPCVFTEEKVDGGQYILYKDYYLTTKQFQTLKFIAMSKQQRQNNKNIMNSFASQESKKLILKIFETENIQALKFNQQEYDLVVSDENQIIIGRSGTGKTTCSILKIILFQVQYLEHTLTNTLNLMDQNLQQTQLKCIYTTLNSQLAGYVAAQYVGYIMNLHEYLQGAYDPTNKLRQTVNTLAQIYSNFKEEDNQKLIHDEELQAQSLLEFDHAMFPAFLNIRQFLCLLDRCFDEPFFLQQQFRNNNNQKRYAEWNNGNQIRIRQKLDGTIINNCQRPDQKGDVIVIDEVEYSTFRDEFWLQSKDIEFQQQHNISYCNLIWTQIYSYIKGSQESHKYPQNYLPFIIYYEYIQDYFEFDEVQRIYNYFLLYEKWKKEQGYFDRMDLTNYLLKRYQLGQYKGPSIHCLFVDEVQDFSNATLKLLSNFTEQFLYLSGDTAQNITKGVGFRFQDLRSIVSQSNFLNNLSCHQLTMNFRTHNNLLQFGNSVVTLLDVFFPKTIDKFNREYSDLEGPKAMIVSSIELILLILSNPHESVGKIEFGTNQAILLKDENSKLTLPALLQDALAFTIFDSKGQEFDDVVLYNFFADSPIPDKQWDLLKNLIIQEVEIDQQVFQSKVTSHTNQKDQNFNQFHNIRLFNGKLMHQKMTVASNHKITLNMQYSLLCNELKMLYVAITRARNRLIIYDSNPANRLPIESIWERLNLFTKIRSKDDIEIYIPKISRTLLTKNQKQEWKKQGFRLFYLKLYDQAYKCFRYAQEQKLSDAAKGYQITSSNHINNKQENQEHLMDKFILASVYFKRADLIEQAAQCLFTAHKYDEALSLYISLNLYNQALASAIQLEYYVLSCFFALKLELYDKAFELALLSHDVRFIHAILLRQFEQISQSIIKTYITNQFSDYIKVIYFEDIQHTLQFPEYQLEFCQITPDDELKRKFKQQLIKTNESFVYLLTQQNNFQNEFQLFDSSKCSSVCNITQFIQHCQNIYELFALHFDKLLIQDKMFIINKNHNSKTSKLFEILTYFKLLPIQIAIILSDEESRSNPIPFITQVIYYQRIQTIKQNMKTNSLDQLINILLRINTFQNNLHSIDLQNRNYSRQIVNDILDKFQSYDQEEFRKIKEKYEFGESILSIYFVLIHNFKSYYDIFLNMDYDKYQILAKCLFIGANLFKYNIYLSKQKFIFEQLCVLFGIIVTNVDLFQVYNNQYCYLTNNSILWSKLSKLKHIVVKENLRQYKLIDVIEQIQHDFNQRLEGYLKDYHVKNYKQLLCDHILDLFQSIIHRKYRINSQESHLSKSLLYDHENYQCVLILLPRILFKVTTKKLDISKTLRDFLKDLALEHLIKVVHQKLNDKMHRTLLENISLLNLLSQEYAKLGYNTFEAVTCYIDQLQSTQHQIDQKLQLKAYLYYFKYLYYQAQGFNYLQTEYYFKYIKECGYFEYNEQIIKDMNMNLTNIIVLYKLQQIYNLKLEGKQQMQKMFPQQSQFYEKMQQSSWMAPYLKFEIDILIHNILLFDTDNIFNFEGNNWQDKQNDKVIKEAIEQLINQIFIHYKKKIVKQKQFIEWIFYIILNFSDTFQIFYLLSQLPNLSIDFILQELLEFTELSYQQRREFFCTKQFKLIHQPWQNFKKVNINISQIKQIELLQDQDMEYKEQQRKIINDNRLNDKQFQSLLISLNLIFHQCIPQVYDKIHPVCLMNTNTIENIYKMEKIREQYLQYFSQLNSLLHQVKDADNYSKYKAIVDAMKAFQQSQNKFYYMLQWQGRTVYQNSIDRDKIIQKYLIELTTELTEIEIKISEWLEWRQSKENDTNNKDELIYAIQMKQELKQPDLTDLK